MEKEKKIRLLPEIVANQVAAGEVVEKPASVAKELVENYIDAGAKNITVDIENGGSRKILVQDDGCGIDSEYVSTAFIRHATSKMEGIRTVRKWYFYAFLVGKVHKHLSTLACL